jgi:hypothetical protein
VIRPFSIIAAFFFAAAAAFPAAAADPASLPLKFSNIPLGNVMRILSAQYGVTFTIEANAKFPISGDFRALSLAAAVAEAARQAKLFAIPLGETPAAGFRLSLRPPPVQRPPERAALAGTPVRAAPPPDESDRVRARLLRDRARLLANAARLDP